jgi:hypothetical protein
MTGRKAREKVRPQAKTRRPQERTERDKHKKGKRVTWQDFDKEIEKWHQGATIAKAQTHLQRARIREKDQMVSS